MLTHASLKKATGGIVWFAALGVLLTLGGCEPDEQTVAQITDLKTELAAVRQRLDEADSQRDALSQQLQTQTQTLTQIQHDVREFSRTSEENGVMASQLAAMKTHLAEVASQRDAAIAEAEKTSPALEQLHRQLQEQIEKTDALGALVADLQNTLTPPVKEIAGTAEEDRPKSNEPVVGFPEVPGFKQ